MDGSVPLSGEVIQRESRTKRPPGAGGAGRRPAGIEAASPAQRGARKALRHCCDHKSKSLTRFSENANRFPSASPASGLRANRARRMTPGRGGDRGTVKAKDSEGSFATVLSFRKDSEGFFARRGGLRMTPSEENAMTPLLPTKSSEGSFATPSH